MWRGRPQSPRSQTFHEWAEWVRLPSYSSCRRSLEITVKVSFSRSGQESSERYRALLIRPSSCPKYQHLPTAVRTVVTSTGMAHSRVPYRSVVHLLLHPQSALNHILHLLSLCQQTSCPCLRMVPRHSVPSCLLSSPIPAGDGSGRRSGGGG